MAPTISPESQKALENQAVQAKVNELSNISRLVVNTLNLICSNDITIPSAYAKPVGEIQDWLNGMHKNIQSQLDTLRPLATPEAPKEAEATKLEVVEASPVKAKKGK